MKTTVLILCLFFIGTTVAQTPSTCSAWSAVFTVTNPAISNNGYNDVTVSFDWSKDVIQFAYPSATEVYQYNTGNGITNYEGQAKFTFGSLCGNCNRNSLLQSQAPLGFGLTNPTSSLAAGAVTGDCRVYTPSTRSDTMLSSISFSTLAGQNGRLCSFTLKDGRVFTYKSGWSCSTPTIQSTDLDGCKCSSRIDVWLLFDHSGSISMTEMAQLKTFGTYLIGNLTLQPTGPGTGAQVGMSWFNDRTGLNFALTDVRSVIDTGLNNWNPNCGGCANITANPSSSGGWTCLPNNDKQNCDGSATPAICQGICGSPQQNIVNVCSQCGGGYTNIALGLIGGTITSNSANYMSTKDYKGVLDFFYGPAALNRNVPKVIITLTDGVANRLSNGATCNSGDCQIISSIAALRAKHNQVFPVVSTRPPLTFLAVGVGPDKDLNNAQLKAAAEGIQSNVLKISNFAEALTKVRNLMDLVCPEGQDTNACPSCCGACVCGTCIPPTACQDSNYCQPRATLGGSTVCCEPTARTCTATPCKDVTCSPTTGTTSGLPGSCVYTDRTCAQTGLPFPACQKKVCNTSDNSCSTIDSSTCTCTNSPCVYGDWSNYDPLTCPSCGSAPTRSRQRVAISGGEFCPGGCAPIPDSSPCPFNCCPKDCAWGPWGAPDVSCACKAGGICNSLETGNTCIQTRTRSKIIDACPGADCVGPSTNVTTTICDCGTTVDCEGHNVTGPCDCETGNYSTYYVVDVEASIDTTPPGAACPFADGQLIDTTLCPSSVYQQQPPETDRCPTDCEEEYSEWSSCNCFFGTRTRNYTVIHQATNDGASCANPNQQQGITVVQTQACAPTEEELELCPTGTVCLVDADCDDSNACTTEHCEPDPRFNPPRSFCEAGAPVTCDDHTLCESAECVPASGCVYTTTVFCNDLNACTNDTCNPDSGVCEFVDITCDDRDDCALGFCDAERGCGIYQRTCNETEDCFTFSCDPDWEENGGIGPCVNTSTCYNPIGVIAAISTGAAIAIALALGFLALLLVGGTASAVAYSQKNAEENKVTTNPMYQQKGHHGHNPFHNN